jgi:hypothetical protein
MKNPGRRSVRAPGVRKKHSTRHPTPTSTSCASLCHPNNWLVRQRGLRGRTIGHRATRPNSYRQLIIELLDYSLWISPADVELLRSIRWSSRLSSQEISELAGVVEAFATGKPRPVPLPLCDQK